MIEAVKTLLSIVWNGFFKSVRLPFLNNMSLATFVISIFIIDLLIIVLKWLILGDVSFGINSERKDRANKRKNAKSDKKNGG